MSVKFFRDWLVMLVVLLVLAFVWHVAIFTDQYSLHLTNMANVVNGAVTPVFPYFLVAHALAALGFAMFVPAVSKSKGQFVWNGVVMGLVTFGLFAFLSQALFVNWALVLYCRPA